MVVLTIGARDNTLLAMDPFESIKNETLEVWAFDELWAWPPMGPKCSFTTCCRCWNMIKFAIEFARKHAKICAPPLSCAWLCDSSDSPGGLQQIVMLISCKQKYCCVLRAVHHGSYCTHDMVAFLIAWWIVHIAYDGQRFCTKDNNVFASCVTTNNLDGPYDHMMIHASSGSKGLVHMPHKNCSLDSTWP